MKKWLFLFIAAYFISTAFSQSYIPMLQSPIKWYWSSFLFGSNIGPYYTGQDTIINTIAYKKTHIPPDNKIIGFIREDTTNKKVFFIKEGETYTNEIVLYNFNVKVNDTIKLNGITVNNICDTGLFIVDSIIQLSKTLTLCDSCMNRLSWSYLDTAIKRKIFYLSSISCKTNAGYRPVWIEGIGSIGLFLSPFKTPINTFGYVSNFYTNNKLILADLSSPEKNEKTVEKTVSLYPNPTNGIVNLDCDNIVKIEIFDVLGIQIMSVTHAKQINISFLEAGTYFIRTTDSDGSIEQTVILKE